MRIIRAFECGMINTRRLLIIGVCVSDKNIFSLTTFIAKNKKTLETGHIKFKYPITTVQSISLRTFAKLMIEVDTVTCQGVYFQVQDFIVKAVKKYGIKHDKRIAERHEIKFYKKILSTYDV